MWRVTAHHQASYYVGQRELGEGRSYATMWRKYKRRVLLAMSSQAFAQLVRTLPFCMLNMTFVLGGHIEWDQWYVAVFLFLDSIDISVYLRSHLLLRS